jgi:hypothetical protein
MDGPMKIYVDIDETICYYEDERNYNLALPIKENIKRINELYDDGHEITYWTARGTATGIDWYTVTEKQLKLWQCKFNHLSVGEKPAYDLLICDRVVNTEVFFKNNINVDEFKK